MLILEATRKHRDRKTESKNIYKEINQVESFVERVKGLKTIVSEMDRILKS